MLKGKTVAWSSRFFLRATREAKSLLLHKAQHVHLTRGKHYVQGCEGVITDLLPLTFYIASIKNCVSPSSSLLLLHLEYVDRVSLCYLSIRGVSEKSMARSGQVSFEKWMDGVKSVECFVYGTTYKYKLLMPKPYLPGS